MADPEQLYARLVSAFKETRWQDASAIAQQLLPLAPRHAGVFAMAGMAQMELRDFTRAAELLGTATNLDPARADFATLHAKALMENRQVGDALRAADRARPLAATDAGSLDALGVLYARGEQTQQAAEAFQSAVALAPTHAPFRLNLATALTTLGHLADAQRELEACTAQAPQLWVAHLALAQARTQTTASNHIDRLQTLLAQHAADAQAAVYVNMALAKEYDDLGQYTQAFTHMTRGKAAKRQQRPYETARDRVMFERLQQAFPPSPASSTGDMTEEPIFIIGMPRTGTTLVERILSRHPHVHAAGELQNFPVALQRASHGPTPLLSSPELPMRAQRIDWQALGSAYLQSTRPATGHTPRFIDKLPHNFLNVGFIARALPRARIICLRRDPLDTCLSNFRQLFDNPSIHFDYSCDLLDTGRYYVMFDRLMRHWDLAFPGRVLSLHYETLVETPEVATRMLLAFCGLPWHEGCLRVEDNPAPIPTYSATQARAPIHRSSLQRWRHYEDHLRPLRQLLAEGGVPLP